MTYIAFRLYPRPADRKTDQWGVENVHSGGTIGVIRWYPRWRQYVMEPNPGTVWSAGCLSDVQHFIAEQMAARKVA